VNLPDSLDNTEPAEKFRERFGDPYPGLDPKRYFEHVYIFRRIWTAKTHVEQMDAGAYIKNVFNRELAQMPETDTPDDPRFRPALMVDFASGRISVKPETLLDFLASWLLVCRDKLAICEREGCQHPYFVKIHARQRFCTPECANSVRESKKAEWWAVNRDRFLKKWRAQRRAAKPQRKRRKQR
jgi:hypothetical protein